MQFFASGIEGADHRVDLLDPLACLLGGLAILGVLKATSEVALCSRRFRHVVQGTRNVHVTHVSTLTCPGSPSARQRGSRPSWLITATEAGVEAGVSFEDVAAGIGRRRSTVAREVRAGGGREGYRAVEVERAARQG